MKCSEAGAFLHAFVDGELAGVDRDAYDQHLVRCDACSHACRLQARFKAAVRGHLPRPPVPERVCERLGKALAVAPAIRGGFWRRLAPRLVPAAAAAVALFALLGIARSRRSPVVLEQALRTYHSALPMDIAGPSCASIADWFRGRVDFAVPPPRLTGAGTCQGGRLVNVRDRFGVYIEYIEANGHRLGLTVFDGQDDEVLDGPRRRHLGGRDIYLHRSRGASTAAYRDRDGLTYVLTGDVDEDALSSFLETALLRR